jgi:hypothetical protein
VEKPRLSREPQTEKVVKFKSFYDLIISIDNGLISSLNAVPDSE